MPSAHHKTQRALLLFTRSPQSEARHKPLSARLTFAEHVELYESFTGHVLRQAQATGYPILVAADAPNYDFRRLADQVAAVLPQRGATFGQKLTHAIAEVFARGYDEIVCVGNDCLELTVSHLQAAFAQLAEAPLVLGAARDGGIYLIGMRRSVLEPALHALASCRWQASITLADLLHAARVCAIATRVLSRRADIDTIRDLIAASLHLPQLAFLQKAASILAQPRFGPEFSFLLSPLHDDRLRYQKAPPPRFSPSCHNLPLPAGHRALH